MKILSRLLPFFCVLLCSCSKSENLISEPQAQKLSVEFVLKSGYTNKPVLLCTRVQGRFSYYRFMDNGALVPSAVRVDRQTGAAEFKKW
jgi:hypothetical protein